LPLEAHSMPGLESKRRQTLPIDMDEDELGELFASCMPRLTKTAKHIMRNSPDSEDVLQEGLLAAFQNLRQFQGRSRFSTWLHSIVRNAARMHMRRKATRPFCLIDDHPSDNMGTSSERAFNDASPSPEELCVESEYSRILRMTLRGLPPMYQRAIELCDIYGLGGADAGAALGLSIPALKTCLHRARRLVSRKIRQSYLLQRFSPTIENQSRGRWDSPQ
jgi:RNA polymerase sigma-70 factor, ECF subfamily